MKINEVYIPVCIPEDSIVVGTYQVSSDTYTVRTMKRSPKEIVLREVIGATHIKPGQYYTKYDDDNIYFNINKSESVGYVRAEDETVYELVKNKC